MNEDINLKRIVSFRTTILYVALDLIIRIGLLFGCYLGLIRSDIATWYLFIVIPIIYITLLKLNRQRLKFKIPKYYKVDLKSKNINNESSKYWIIFSVLGIIATLLLDQFSDYGANIYHIIFGLVFSLAYLVISFMILLNSSTLVGGTVFLEDDDGKHVKKKLSDLFKANLLGKENDWKTENNLKAQGLRIELENNMNFVNNLTNEAVFIGALVFSGFISIITSDKIHDKSEIFTDTLNFIGESFHYLVSKDFMTFFNLLEQSDILYGIIALLSIFCSMLFVLVLIFKSLMYNVLLRATKILELATSHKNGEASSHSIITKTFDSVNESIANIAIVNNFLKSLRFLGYLLLLIILILSGLFFSLSVSLIISLVLLVSISIFTLIYMYVKYKQFDIDQTYRY